MPDTTTQTPMLQVNWRQTALSAMAAMFSAALGAIYLVVQNAVNTHTFVFTMDDLKLVLAAGILAFLGFIQHHLFTDQNGNYLGKF